MRAGSVRGGRWVFGWIVLVALVALAACRRPRGEVREWRPEDHDRTDESPAAGRVPGRAPAASASGAAASIAPLVEATWRTQCALCHGMGGAGDGPQGPMVRAPNLTRADWQAKVTDAEIAATITEGRGRMPKFDLPPDVVRGLVQRIRTLGGR